MKYKCFLCSNCQHDTCQFDTILPPRYINVLQVLCQLLRISWDAFKAYNQQNLPFCADCCNRVMEVIDLREQLVKLENEMIRHLRQLEATVANTVVHDDEKQDDSTRKAFRRQMMNEYNAKMLLRQKIKDAAADNFCCKIEPIEEEQSQIIIEPSFVQLHLRLGIDVDDTDQYKEAKSESSNDYSSNWITNQNGPLTRLRLSTAIPESKFTQESVSEDFQILPDSYPSEDEIFEEDAQDLSENNSEFEVEEDDFEDSDFEVHVKSKKLPPRTRSVESKSPNKKSSDKTNEICENKASKPRRWPAEEFSEIQLTEDGRRFFEGIEILYRAGDKDRGEYILTCGACPKEFDKKNATSQQRSAVRLMQMHIKAYHLKAYDCLQCGKVLRDHRRLILHTEVQHPPGGKPVKVRRARVFGSQKLPAEVSMGEDGISRFQDIQIVRTEFENGDFTLHCGVCSKDYNKALAHRSKQCPYRQMVNHIKAFHLLSYSCEGCQKTFRCQSSLKKHVAKMHSENPIDLRCAICEKPISGEVYLRRHMWTHKSTEEKQEALDAGEKGPRTYRELMERRKAMGLGASYQCSQCGKTFHFGANLRRHEFVHKKDIKEHKCAHCGKLFNTSENLKSHIKYIHETERVHKKYRCSYCPKWFVTKSPWEKHERTHTKHIPYYCPTCNKGFALKQSMMNHVRNKKCSLGQQSTSSKFSHRAKKKPTRQPTETAHESTSEGSADAPAAVSNLPQSFLGPITTIPSSLQPIQIMPVQLEVPAQRSNMASTTITVPFAFSTYSGPYNQNYSQPHYNTYH